MPKRKLASKEPPANVAESSSSNSSNDDEELSDEELSVEFEAIPMQEADIDGVSRLLDQVFRHEPSIDTDAIASALVRQTNIGCIVTPIKSDDDKDDDVDVFAVVSALDFNEKAAQPVLLRLRDAAKEKKAVKALSSKRIGLVVNQRLLNLPCRIAVPALESLIVDLQKANSDLETFVFVTKLYRPIAEASLANSGEGTSKKAQKSAKVEPAATYANAEEEFLEEFCDVRFDYTVAKVDEDEVSSFRRVFVLHGMDAFRAFVERAKKEVTAD